MVLSRLASWLLGWPDPRLDSDWLVCFADVMPGASDETRQVKVMNANWIAGPDGADGSFEVMIVTEDDQQYTVSPSPASITALLALAKADTILLWDPTNRALIAANIVGTWIAPTGLTRATVAPVER
jgi:hypothetical protein